MIKALTKSNNSFVNTFFGVSLITSILYCILRPIEAWVSQSDMSFAIASSILSFILWWVVLGLYRLFKS